MKLFDCYCGLGPMSVSPPRYAATAEELLDEMAWVGIDEALVVHNAVRPAGPGLCNPRIVEAVAGRGNLHPTWAILPPATGEQATGDEFFRQMKAAGVWALYAFPAEHGYLLDDAGFGEAMERLVERRIPLLMRANWPDVAGALRQWPKLRLLVVGQGPHGADRYFRPLIEKYPDFYIDTSTYLQDGGIEEFVGRYGAKRMLFGTGYPGNCIGGPVLRLQTAEIDQADMALIAHGNIERLKSEVSL